MALALMSGCAIYGSAQTAYSGRPMATAFFDDHDRDHERAWEEGRRRAQEIGFQDGQHDGRSDFDKRHHFQPTHGGAYRHGDHGYDGHFGDKERYIEAYREAYSRGYHEGFYGNRIPR
jgi:hypothetical protein